MTRTFTPTGRRTESLAATIRSSGAEFTFELHSRPLEFGPDVTIQYYWMDSSRFRIARGNRCLDPMNFRTCIGLWWRAMQSAGLGDDQVQIGHLVLATSYGLVSRSNALQHVYRDAHLNAAATDPEGQSLPDEARARIDRVVRSRNADRVREELDGVLGRLKVPPDEILPIRQTFDGLLRHGVGLVREAGNDGLEEFLGRFDAWCEKHRKKGGGGWLRHFLDVFSYECKTSFYLCYANAWIGLIPWLRENRDLDAMSERFLRFWHMQNQPMERADGRVIHDPFNGQVLSLHPLSGFFMKDEALRAITGRYFASDPVDGSSVVRPDTSSEYWGLVGVILSAANLYRQALDAQADHRGVHTGGYAGSDPEGDRDSHRSVCGMLEDVLADRAFCRPGCGGRLRVSGFHPAEADAERFEVDCTCPTCRTETRLWVDRSALEGGFTADD